MFLNNLSSKVELAMKGVSLFAVLNDIVVAILISIMSVVNSQFSFVFHELIGTGKKKYKTMIIRNSMFSYTSEKF